MRAISRALILAGFASVCFMPSSRAWTEQIEIPIFDVHSHFHDHVQKDLTPKEALGLIKQAGISHVLLSSWPGDGTPQLYSLAADRVVPGLAFYKEDSILNPHDRLIWRNDVSVPDRIEEQLKKGSLPYKTIGEFHIFVDEPPTPVMMKVAEIAIRHGLILHAHAHHGSIEKWIDAVGPRLKIIWAHAGMTCSKELSDWCPKGISEESATAAKVKEMLGKYPNLYIELSARDSMQFAPITVMRGPDRGKLLPEWKELIQAFPDRVMLGTDPFVTKRWESLKDIADEMRVWLRDLPEGVAKKVAYENAEKLLLP